MNTKPGLITPDEFRALLQAEHPFSSVLDIQVLEIGLGTARALLPDNPSHQRLGGIVAGPMLMALADVALYAAVIGATGNPKAVTASMTINFMRGAPAGGIVAHAQVHKTGRMPSAEARLYPVGSEDLVAQIVSTWALPPAPPAG